MGILKSIFGGSSSKSSATSTPTDTAAVRVQGPQGWTRATADEPQPGTDADPLGGIPQFGQPDGRPSWGR